MTAATEAFGAAEFQRASNVSRETLERLEGFVVLLQDWNTRHSLVSSGSLADVWRRHLWDCAQLAQLIPPGAKNLVDLGSGAGFPGLILALLLRDRPMFRTVLFEATRKKCDFLSLAAEALGLRAEIRNSRIEETAPEPFDLVTARACAPLPRLLLYAQAFQAPGTLNLFLKGQSVAAELTEAHKSWNMKVQEFASRSDPSGVILAIEGLRAHRMRRT